MSSNANIHTHKVWFVGWGSKEKVLFAWIFIGDRGEGREGEESTAGTSWKYQVRTRVLREQVQKTRWPNSAGDEVAPVPDSGPTTENNFQKVRSRRRRLEMESDSS